MRTPEIFSEVAAVAATIELATNWELPNSFIAIKYFDADPTVGPATEVVPGAGTVTITAKLVNHGKYVDITDGVFPAPTVNTFASFLANVEMVKAVPAGITTATHYQLVVTQNS
jgi:hypothetical protein